MSKDGYLTNHCQHCGGGVEFPGHGVGAEIECPHCQHLMRLVTPPESKTAALSAGQLLPEAPLSPAGLLFLSKFLSSREIADVIRDERWNLVLEVHPSVVVDRFMARGLLEMVTPDLVSLLCSKSGNDLKNFAKERGLPSSGTKPVLARRLSKTDPEGMADLFRGKTYLSCTQVGRELAERFLATEAKAEQHAQAQSLAALRHGEFEQASRVVASFAASRIFGGGAEDHWQQAQSIRDIGVLRLLFSECLARHAHLEEKVLRNIRVAAAMMQLWGTNNPKSYLEAGLSLEVDWVVETGLLLSRALGIVRLEEMKAAGIERVQVLASGDPADCEKCIADNNKTYQIGSAPFLPHQECTCQTGCRCILLASE